MDLTLLSVIELSEALKKHEITSIEIAEAYLQRIAKKDGEIGAYITVCNQGTLEASKNADTSLSDIAGIPVAVKDNICTKGITTTCASKMLYGYVPPYDASVIEKLKSAGSFVLGKLNMDEFGMGSSTENSALKLTKNPYDYDRVPGGSSGGAAAAVAAYEAPFAIASDTGGSIRQPAAFCGVVGMKPTYGSVSRYGLVAFASSLDQIGPITRTVRDNRLIFNIICGKDARDSTTAESVYERDAIDISSLRIAVLSELMDSASADVKEKIIKAASKLERLGAQIDILSLPEIKSTLSAYYIISSAEASSNLARYDGVRYGYRVKNFDDIDDMMIQSRSEGFGEEVKRRIMLGTFALSTGYHDAYYKRAKHVQRAVINAFDRIFKSYDLILAPTTPGVAFRFGEMKNDPTAMYRQDICTVPASIAGLPALSLPVGKNAAGLPIGAQLIGAAFYENLIYSVAELLEREVKYCGL